MIKARIAEENKVCLVFDNCQTDVWVKNGRITGDGISHILKLFVAEGVPITGISAVCLCDEMSKGKSSDYEAKREYIEELFAVRGYNVLVPVGADAFTRTVGFKGQSKYLKKTLLSEVYKGQKVIPLQNPSQAKYDPSVLGTISETIKLIRMECEFPEMTQVDRLPTHYTIIDSLKKFDSFYEEMIQEENQAIAYDLETTGLMFNRDEITTIQFSHRPGYSYLIPCLTIGEYPAAPNIWSYGEWAYILEKLHYLFTNPRKIFVGHNKKFDDKFIFHHWDIPLQKGRSWDTMIASFLCNENTPNGLKDLACALTDLGDYEKGLEEFKDAYCKNNKVLKKPGKDPSKPIFSYGMVPFDILAPYALADADATIRLYHHFKDELLREEQEEPFRIVMRITWLLTRFELNGWPINVDYGYELKAKLEQEIEELRLELLEHPLVKEASGILAAGELHKKNLNRKKKLEALPAPFVFNMGSGQQKSVLFYDVMNLPVVKFTKKAKKPAVDKESLSIWCRTKPKHKAFLKQIDRYSEMCKFLSTYVVGILSKCVNGRVHPTYNAVGAKTARTSSKEPNFQNLPARGDDRKMKLVKAIKRMVQAPEGRILEGADLSAIEMVWAAIVSGDPRLIQIFNADGLIHESVAKELFDYITCPLSEVKKRYEFERNSISKTIQFLSLYGGGPDALMRKVNDSINERRDKALAEGKEPDDIKEFTKEQAQEILTNYFRKYSGLDRYIKMTSAAIGQNGFAVSPYGFKRRVPAVNSTDDGIKAQAVRQGVNQTIQNPASISLLLALCNFQEEIDEQGWDIMLIGSVHDAGYEEVAEELKQLGRERLLYWMTQPPIPDCPVPIRAECEWGKSWADFTDDFGSALVDEDEEDEDEDMEDAA